MHGQDLDSLKVASFYQYYENEQYEQAIELGTELHNVTGAVSKDNEDYLKIISNLADCHYNCGNTYKAIELDTQALELSKKFFGETHPSYANALNDLAVYYSDLGDYGKAIELGTQAMETRKRLLGEEHPLFVISLDNLAYYYSEIEDYEKAIEFGTQVLEIRKKVLGEEHPDYVTTLTDLALYYYDFGDYEKAIMFNTQALTIRKKVLGEEHLDCAYSMGNLASCYSKLGNYSKAIELGTKAMDIFKKELGKEHPDYLTYLGNLAFYHDKFGEYKKALELNKQVVKIKEKVLGEEHPDYASSISSLAINYSHLGDYNRAIELGQQALNIRKKTLGEEHPDYAESLNNLAKAYEGIGNYPKAIELGTQALKILEKAQSEELPYYAIILNNLASAYEASGNYSKAIELGTKSLMIRKGVWGEEHPEYAKVLFNLARCYSGLGDDAKALDLSTQALEIRRKTLGTDHPDYAISLAETSHYYAYHDNFSEAIRLGAQATDILKKGLGPKHIDYAKSLIQLADYYDHIGNYDEAIRLGEESLDIIKTQLGVNHPDYASLLISLANYYFHINDYHESIQLNKEAMRIVKKNQGTKNYDYAILLNNIANDYEGLGKYNKAIKLLKKALDIRKKLYGADHPRYANSLSNLASAYKGKGDTGEAIRLGTIALNISKNSTIDDPYNNNTLTFLANLSHWQYEVGNNEDAVALVKEYLQLVRNSILTTFLGLTANERLMYWGQCNYNYSDYAPKVIIDSNLPDAASILYDNISLFAKGLLLTTEVEITKLIQESGDTEALQLYSELQRNRKVLSEQYSKTLDESNIDCDSLEHVTAYLERELASRVKEIGDYTQNLSITWRDVQSKLGENDIAIEFLSYPENDSITAYVALTLCKNDSAPTLTPLFTNLQLIDVASDDDTYQNVAAADRLIWGTLAPRLERKSHVYFSAAGMLHNIGIEYLPSMEGKDCYRLSSTRELVTHKPSEGGKSATLFGGIDYDATYASLRSTAKNEPSATYLADNTMTIPVGLNRGGFNYSTMRGTRYSVSRLPHSKTEIQEISAFLKKNGFFVQDCDTIRATEGSFKALSGQRKSLIHISTHGFYYDEDEAENKAKHMRMMLMGENRPTNIEDQSLLRCGLCFAGANQAFTGDSLPADGQDDGILNALEIAQMDLRGLDLVVLSACQTALGDIIVGQGVFGLQRGFKKAGANSILMSLWEVDDEVTSKFMIEFYRQWTSGKAKMESLKKAQSVIRQEYPDPKYWAAFILLDALD